MDGRLILSLALLAPLAFCGCAFQQNHLSGEPVKTVSLTDVLLGKDGPSQKTTVNVGLAFARLREGQAADAKNTPREREKLLEDARLSYQRVLELSPESVEAATGLARVHAALNDHERALATYRKVLEKHPRLAVVWHDLAMCQARRKDFVQAITCCKKAHELEPENRTYANTLGWLLARAGRFQESFALMGRLHGEAQAHYKMAQMLAHLKQPEQCRQHLQLALQKNPELTAAREMLTRLDQEEPGGSSAGRDIVTGGPQMPETLPPLGTSTEP